MYGSSRRSVETARTRAYVLHMLQAEDVIEYDLKVSALRTDNGIQLAVRNNTGQSWFDAWLVSGQSIYRLGPVTHNEGSALTLSADTAHFDLEAIRTQRATWGLFRDRRPDLYGPLMTSGGG